MINPNESPGQMIKCIYCHTTVPKLEEEVSKLRAALAVSKKLLEQATFGSHMEYEDHRRTQQRCADTEAALATARQEERERVASIVEDHGMDADFIRALKDESKEG